SSVIKELVENSIDSGATQITVEIKNGGITFMRVTDNGCGILKDDIRNAFLRHATSKVREQDDLDSIGTLGFRGEALASISAVARVELLTKAAEDETGSRYIIEGCDEVLFEDIGRPQGTTFIVRDIFYNVPARMKFLKKDVAEANAVAAVIDKEALSHSEVAFTFIRDGKQTLVTSGDGKLLNCIYSVYGKEFTKGVIPVDYSLNGVSVSGYVTKPQASRSSRAMQTFFINGRFVKSRTAMAALEEACKGMVMVGKFPGCVLHINLSLAAVDVNVHPAKIEVRFINERPIFDAIYHAVKTAVIKGDTVKEFSIKSANPTQNLIDKSVVQKPYTMSQYTVNKIKNTPIIRPSEVRRQNIKAVDVYNNLLEDVSEKQVAKKTVAVTDGLTDIELSDSASDSRYFGVTPIVKPNNEVGELQSTDIKPKSSSYVSIDIVVDEDEEIQGSDFGLRSSKNMPVENSENDRNIGAETNCLTSGSIMVYGIADEVSNMEDMSQKPPLESEFISDLTDNTSDKISTFIPTNDDKIRFVGEAFKTYIIIEKNNNLVLIDKHAAHERMIYEKLKRDRGAAYSQLLLEPVTVTLSKQQYTAVLEKADLLMESGFEVSDFGQGTILVRSAPSFIDAFDVAETVEEMADHILDNKKDISSEYTDWLYHNIACRSAIKGGDLSSPEELMKIAMKLDEDVNYKYCPHGRPTSMVITRNELEKQFGRV
ncbi:MAG: DNA mismatch repair endonuclease MutL, partial [Lachnospiraceae bacterium]|nr:DNA mismatch repair endonuclease MutL [Lachnospiraceae bacterium]